MKYLAALLLFLPIARIQADTESDIRIAMAMASATADRVPETKPEPAKPQHAPGFPYVEGWHFFEQGEKSIAGYHWHYCPKCGRYCQHDDDNFNDAAAHTCVCGNGPVWQKCSEYKPSNQVTPIRRTNTIVPSNQRRP